ncbi:hypothetical protein PRIPAC_94196 [Pristionchus pacificus]|uniref:Uncharacterized protein n=1 Tax=Pristionchus pacificus TaxID=54126 RepID=A0A2A6BPZ0_PRIPA|nr:hypothetical protein PRIPAC_94196 [Pristionchus pacificus]|eukprot:PDM67831.1 hypothetical protein PRIPAC_45875 [Pristionchus pacificus]
MYPMDPTGPFSIGLRHSYLPIKSSSPLSLFLPMTLSVCPNGTLHLGFVPDFFPYIWKEDYGSSSGILAEFWSTMAPLLGCSNVDYRFYAKQRTDSGAIFDGDIASGETFTAVGLTWLRPNDPLSLRYTSSVIWSKMVFVESSQSPVFQSTDLSFYAVFPTDIFIMLVASFIVVEIFDRLHIALMTPKGEEKIPLSILDFLRSIPFLYWFTFLLFIWNGNFKGNTLVTSPFSQTTFSSMVASFRGGSRKLVLNSGDNYFTQEEVPIILGSYDNADWCEEMEDCFQMVCNKTSRVGLFYEPDIYSFFASNLTETCSLAQISLSRGQSSGIGWLTRSLKDGDFYNFVISKQHRRWVLEKINFALLTVYTAENINTIFLRRSLPFEYFLKAARKQEDDLRRTELQPITPVSFIQIALPLQILAIGTVISLALFIAEQIIWRVKIPKVSRFFRSILKSLNAEVTE